MVMRHFVKSNTMEYMSDLCLSADLTVIAVGVARYNFPELREIATDPETHVFTAKDFDELLNLVASLRKKACTGEFITELKADRATGSLTEFFDVVCQNAGRRGDFWI